MYICIYIYIYIYIYIERERDMTGRVVRLSHQDFASSGLQSRSRFNG